MTRLDQYATQTFFCTLKPLVPRSTFLARVHPITMIPLLASVNVLVGEDDQRN